MIAYLCLAIFHYKRATVQSGSLHKYLYQQRRSDCVFSEHMSINKNSYGGLNYSQLFVNSNIFYIINFNVNY